MKPIPLVRANVLVPHLEVLRDLGIPTASGLMEAKLPASLEAEPEVLISFQQGCRFVDRVARREGIHDLGLRAGERARIGRMGVWGRRIERSLTLYEALERMTRTFRAHTSAARYQLIERGPDVLFCHRLHESIDVGRDHACHYVLLTIIDLVQSVAGRGWRPHEIRVAAAGDPRLRAVDVFADARIVSDPSATAVAIPRALLGAALPNASRFHSEPIMVPLEPLWPSSPALDFLGSLKQAIAPLVQAGTPDIFVAAELAGTSVRTLQRRLLEEGVSFSRLIDEVRFAMATRWLEDPHLKMIDVAFELGYSDPAHFTRAFRRWTGVSPREFRRERLRPRALLG